MKTGVGRLVTGERFLDPEMHEDPYRRYREIRESSPVFWDESLHAWILTRYADVGLVLNDPRFSSNRIAAAQSQLTADRYRPLLDIMSHKMSENDEPDHTRLRSLVNRAFAHVAVEEWTPKIQQRIETLLDGFRATGHCEFIADFAVPLPLMTIMEFIGVPAEDHLQVKHWCDAFSFVALNFYTQMTEEQIEEGLVAMSEFRTYLQERIACIEKNPECNLLNALIEVEHEGVRLSMDELLANAFLLLSAGNETTTCLLGNGVAALLRYPDQMQRLRKDPALIPLAVEEFLRYDSPVQYIGRIANEDMELHSTKIRKGDLLLAVLAAANRDPEQFAEPETLDVGRSENHHFAFGHGRHFCIGSHFARMEACLTFQALLEHSKDISLNSVAMDELRHHDNFNIRCLKRLPLEITFAH